MSFMDEIRKIPPVTRFLCGSSLGITLPVILQIASPYKLVFVRHLVTQNWEIWRVFTSFFLGGSGINYLFDFIMLYRNSDQLEAQSYVGRSADYAWQLLLACGTIVIMNLPLSSAVHTRPLLVCLTYLASRLAPAGSQTSIFGLVTIPVVYFPYALIALDLIMAGPRFAAASVTGAVAGHLWWWGMHHTRAFAEWGRPPAFFKNWIDGPGGVPEARTRGGVTVVPPRREDAGNATGHRWGSGHRLGDS